MEVCRLIALALPGATVLIVALLSPSGLIMVPFSPFITLVHFVLESMLRELLHAAHINPSCCGQGLCLTGF